MLKSVRLHPELPEVCRLGLATRGNTHLTAADVRAAIDRAVGYLNWCGRADGMSRAVSELPSSRRVQIVLATQFAARTWVDAERELSRLLRTLKSDRIDVLTFYYVESDRELGRITGPEGSLEYLKRAVEQGKVGLLGLTTHQRRLAARRLREEWLDLVMVRYNAAHRGAEREVFPIARRYGVPVVAFTCMRWGALLERTPTDPAGLEVPKAPDWYRFVLAHPDVAVALAAPDNQEELRENLSLLDDWRSPSPDLQRLLLAHGDRVRAHAVSFP